MTRILQEIARDGGALDRVNEYLRSIPDKTILFI